MILDDMPKDDMGGGVTDMPADDMAKKDDKDDKEMDGDESEAM